MELQEAQSLKFEPHCIPPMIGRFLLATSPNPTEYSGNRQEEEKGPRTSHGCIFAAIEPIMMSIEYSTFYARLWSTGWLGSQRERKGKKRVPLLFFFFFF